MLVKVGYFYDRVVLQKCGLRQRGDTSGAKAGGGDSHSRRGSEMEEGRSTESSK